MNFSGIDMSRMSPYAWNPSVLQMKGTPYKLLAYLSEKYDNAIFIDLGTHDGLSAAALAYNARNTVYSFDIVDRNPKRCPNAVYLVDDLWNPASRDACKSLILSSTVIFMDVDGGGELEFSMYKYLLSIDYKGLLVCNDIWETKAMRDNFWLNIPYASRYDLSESGSHKGTGAIAFGEQTFPKPDLSNWTLVTAYFDLTKCPDASEQIRARPRGYYLEQARFTLRWPLKLVVYCDTASIGSIRAIRGDLPTTYIIREFDELVFGGKTVAEWRQVIQSNRRKCPYAFDPRNTASYYLLCMSRYLAMQEAIASDQDSTHFAWINIDIERMGWTNLKELEGALAIHREKFSTCYIDYIPESLVMNTPEYFKWGRCGMCSGFFTGGREFMRAVSQKLHEAFVHYADLGYGHADEQLFSVVYFQNQELFDYYYGDYHQMITNYVRVKEHGDAVVRNFIRNSFDHGDFKRCMHACDHMWVNTDSIMSPDMIRALGHYRSNCAEKLS